ncbi:hypothetical protein, partial [Isoptericola sp. NPDC060257]|uniref:hypothetical protein n=1 Tax=Isoptericola sp. NPDC060257 TaxID=3347087 RepID=UPI0036695318
MHQFGVRRGAVAVAAAAALSLSAQAGWAASATDEGERPVPDVLSVDFAQTTGAFRGGATGTLYGFGDDGVPTQALIDGARITNSSQKAPYGTQHPSGDALTIEDGFFAKHGQELAIYIQDYYPDWSYNGGKRPGDSRTYDQATGTYVDEPNGVWDYLEIVEFVTEAVATQSDHPEKYLFIPFNEPDGGNWYPDWPGQKDQFLADWQATYEKIQEVYDRHGLGHARIGGPGDTRWQPERSADYLTYAKAHGVLPDVFIWHELGIDNLATFRSHMRDYRQLEQDLGIDPIHVNITEYGMLRDMGVPGQLVQWLSMFEDEKVDAQTAYWNYAGNLSDNTARAGGANAGWWMFKWYGDLEGSQTVQVDPPHPDTVDTLQGIGAIDEDDRRATVLLGGTDDDVRLDLSGLDRRTFGQKVDVEVREVTLSGAQGLANTPRVVQRLDGAKVRDGGLELDLDPYDRYAAYQVVVTPARGADAAPEVWTTSIEAEDTALTDAQVYEQDPQGGGGWKFLASGGRDVGSFNKATSRADWTVTVPRDGTYRLQVIGATPGVPGRHALFVDGALDQPVQYTADLALTSAQKWQYRGSTEVQVELAAGEHVLSLRASEDGSTLLPNADITLDKLVLTDVSDGEPTAYPASTMRLAGGARLDWDRGNARGFARVQGEGQRAEVYATAMESGYYDVTVRHTSTRASDLTLTVNGRAAASFGVRGPGAWTSTARVHLAEGINELELASDAGSFVGSVTTTRAPDDAAVTVQAEDAALHGTAVVATKSAASGSNASGGKVVEWLGDGAENYLEIARAAGFDAAGDYDVTVRYANAELSGKHDYNPQVVDRELQVTEGDAVAGATHFRYTFSWDSFWERTVPVTLATADRPLRFGNPDAFAPNIDAITIAPLVAGEPSTQR